VAESTMVEIALPALDRGEVTALSVLTTGLVEGAGVGGVVPLGTTGGALPTLPLTYFS